MANWLQRLETRWMRRHSGPRKVLPQDAGRVPVALITGASEGIGRALADEFARNGRALLLVARHKDQLEKAAVELRGAYGGRVIIAAIDLSLPDSVAQLEAVLDEEALYPDYLVNNAAIGLGGAFADQDVDQVERLIGLNVLALTKLTRRFLPDMLARAQGGVLNIASLGGLLPGPYQAAYYASKAYVISFTEALAYENAGRGVRISVVTPGPVATRFHEKIGASEANYLKLQTVPSPQTVARVALSGFVGRRRFITPGVLATFNFFAIRVVPHFILAPLMAWFFNPRR